MRTSKETILNYFNELCKVEKIEPVKVEFRPVGKGGACVCFTAGKIPTKVCFDLNRMLDPEVAIYHELAHIVRLRKAKDAGHGKAFQNAFVALNDKYMYSKLSQRFFN